ncbi:MAG TPA: hypothetical protein ENI23_09870 [bacterium]|nr:hypothetical protein [bacterium]
MKYKEIKRILSFIIKYFNENDFKWCLGASCSLMVHGVDIKPDDIDIVVDLNDIRQIRTDLKKYNLSEIDNGLFGKAKFEIFNIQIESNNVDFIGFDNKDRVYETKEWEGLKIPVNPLKNELGYYKTRSDKRDTVIKIEERLLKLRS